MTGENRPARIAVQLVTALLFLAFITSPVSAAVVGYVAEGSDGNYYEFNYGQLLESYVLHILGSSAPLYSDYSKKTVRVLLDDVKGYVDYDDALEAYVLSIINGQSFDLNKYTAGSQAKKADMPGEVYVVSLGSDGTLQFTRKILDEVDDLLAAVNGASNQAELEALITSKALELGLDLTPYTKLNRYGQTAALNEVLARKPEQGFNSLAQVKSIFNEAVTAAQAALDAALKAINEAADANIMKQALGDKGDIMELGLGRYNLTATELDTLSARLLQLKPFSSLKEMQRILHTAVMAIRSGFVINHTRYGYTLNRMLDIQMGLSYPPQTDLYGGGWQNARREDVAYYINPYNFIDMDYDGTLTGSIRIAVDSLRVRQRPTTQSPQLVDATGNPISVKMNQVYAILAEAEAEAGTEAGTEGKWYKIGVSGQEGWVCGRHVGFVESAFSANTIFQFLLLSGSAGTTVEDLEKILGGKGILDGKGAAFMEASRNNNINEIFLVSLALHETGNGTSLLARGIEVEDRDDIFPDQDFVVVYNMFGVGAYDSNPNHYGSQFAYDQRWFTPEEAIVGGARFASERYVNHPSYFQNTLYKMRWNPSAPGTHQYATDIGWAAKQVSRIRSLYNLVNSYTLTFDIPRYQE